VLSAIKELTLRNGSPVFSRQELIKEELQRIINQTGSPGETPEQSLSRELQALRNQGLLLFIRRGSYYFIDDKIDLTTVSEDLTDKLLDYAIKHNTVSCGSIDTDEVTRNVIIRRGQDKVRKACIESYKKCCAICSISEEKLLVASHI